MSKEQMVAFFDERSEGWDDQGPEPREAILRCLNLMGLRTGARVLDIGCGTGLLEPYLLAAGAEGIVAIDLSGGMIAKALAKFGDDPRIRFVCGDVTEFETEEPFDLAIMFNVYPHLIDKEALMAAVQRALKPNGRFAIAHGKGRDAINEHHMTVPHEISHALQPASDEATRWGSAFDIDIVIDDVDFYCVSGTMK